MSLLCWWWGMQDAADISGDASSSTKAEGRLTIITVTPLRRGLQTSSERQMETTSENPQHGINSWGVNMGGGICRLFRLRSSLGQNWFISSQVNLRNQIFEVTIFSQNSSRKKNKDVNSPVWLTCVLEWLHPVFDSLQMIPSYAIDLQTPYRL